MLLKYAFRNLKKRPALNAIKIIGLALGLCGLLFISLFIKNELSYESHHQKAENIYRLTTTTPNVFENQHFARFYASELLPDLLEPHPEVQKFVRLAPLRGKLIQYQQQFYGINQGFVVDPSYFEIFDVSFLQGSAKSAVEFPHSVVLSKSLVTNLFGNQDPIGKTVTLPKGHFNAEEKEFRVTGVMTDPAQNSHKHPDILFMPGENEIEGWAYQYVLLGDGTDIAMLGSNLSSALGDLFTPEGAEEPVLVTAHLTNIKDIHLRSNLFREIEPNGNVTNLYVMALAGLVLLLISLSNFMSLNLGMAGYLSSFLTLNKIMGSSKRIMLRYFLLENAIVVLLALGLVIAALFPLNQLIYETYQLDLLRGNGVFAFVLLLTTAILMILAGLQPVLKNKLQSKSLQQTLKNSTSTKGQNGLLVTQFTLAIVLLIGVVVISKQTQFGLEQAMGAQESILCLPSVHSEVQKDFALFKAELLKETGIQSVSAMMDSPGSETHDMFAYELEGTAPQEPGQNLVGVFAADYSFADVFGLSFLSGQNFGNDNIDENGNGEYLINKSALHHFGYQDANAIVGKRFSIFSPVPDVQLPEGKIIGVVDDFHLSGLQNKVEPLVLFKRADSWLNSVVISYQKQSQQSVVDKVQSVWEKLFPKYPLNYVPVDSIYEQVYRLENLQKQLLLLFALVSIVVSIMGVLGLALMIAQNRYKEIGIRKVNGATRFEVVSLLNSAFLKWLLLASILALPLGYLAAKTWLQGFAYAITLNLWIFILPGFLVVMVTLLTVTWQSYKAATQNPVDSLRLE